jgi:hypothetical protein
MRHILVEHARKRDAGKSGGGVHKVYLEDATEPSVPSLDMRALDQTLQQLEKLDPQEGRIVELRVRGGNS